jgi:hypothetical protein
VDRTLKDLLQYIKLVSPENSQEASRIRETIESIYFLYLRPWHRFLSASEPSRIAFDLVHLEEALRTQQSFKHLRFRSAWMNADPLLARHLTTEKLEAHVIDQIRDTVIAPNHYYIPAMMIADIIRRDHIQERLRWFTTILLTILAALAALILKALGEIR